ncbi:hypothetical protein V7968_26010 [Nocardia vulneris]
MDEVVYKVTGMSCAHCVTEQAPVSLRSVGAALEAAGYELAQA